MQQAVEHEEKEFLIERNPTLACLTPCRLHRDDDICNWIAIGAIDECQYIGGVRSPSIATGKLRNGPVVGEEDVDVTSSRTRNDALDHTPQTSQVIAL